MTTPSISPEDCSKAELVASLSGYAISPLKLNEIGTNPTRKKPITEPRINKPLGLILESCRSSVGLTFGQVNLWIPRLHSKPYQQLYYQN